VTERKPKQECVKRVPKESKEDAVLHNSHVIFQDVGIYAVLTRTLLVMFMLLVAEYAQNI